MAWNTSTIVPFQQTWSPYNADGSEQFEAYNSNIFPDYTTMNLLPDSLRSRASDQISESSQGFSSFDSVDPISTQKNPFLSFQSLIEENQQYSPMIHDHSPDHSSENNSKSSSLVCTYQECKRPGPFCNKGTLKRHIKTQHISPQSFKCPYSDCTMSFNRKDNLDQHLRSNVHWK